MGEVPLQSPTPIRPRHIFDPVVSLVIHDSGQVPLESTEVPHLKENAPP